jgi:xanthine dehydrogenase D subunit
MVTADQPVLAEAEVRYEGEPVAIVAAVDPELARQACDDIRVKYEVIDPLTDPEVALAPTSPLVHPEGNIISQIHIGHGDPDARGDVVVTGEYKVGMQDQAFLGPEAGLAVPDGRGGVDLYVATQWLHLDRDQICHSLGLPADRVRLELAGVGGAFGGREDLSVQIHACMLALATGQPVKMMYGREESFHGHVHRHPARLRYEHTATRHGLIVSVRARLLFDGGPYRSTSDSVCGNAAAFACGPYEVPNATVDSYVVRTNNPVAGAMRGVGTVQACFAYEAQMDRLAQALDMDPFELRLRNAMRTGSKMITGQVLDGPAPVRELLLDVASMATACNTRTDEDFRALPGGTGLTTRGEGVRRGTAVAVSIKGVTHSGSLVDSAVASVRLTLDRGEVVGEVRSAAVEVGQGLVAVQSQIVREELGICRVEFRPVDTTIGSAGSSSASRQTWMTGGAIQAACDSVRHVILERAAVHSNMPRELLRLSDGAVVGPDNKTIVTLASVLADGSIEATREYRKRQTSALDPATGQGDAYAGFAFAAHRATVDVDVELGLVRVVEIATAQEVGRAVNPIGVLGQIEGGIAQGVGLAVMEEIQLAEGKMRNPSFTDYLIPTVLDMPDVRYSIRESGNPGSPYGVTGVGEPPAISSTAAVVAALRAATGLPLTRTPVRPEDIATFETA